MKRKESLKYVLLLFVFFSSCKIFAEGGVPYQISGEMILDPSSEYENAGLEFAFFNKSQKTVSSFTMVFYVFDEDGNPPLAGRNNIVIKIDSEIDGLDCVNKVTSLDKFLTVIPQEPYEVDYLYVSRILYSDGTEWSDPFGFAVF